MVEALYLDDMYLQQFDAEVISVTDGKLQIFEEYCL